MRLMLEACWNARELFRAVRELADDAGYLPDWTLLEHSQRARPDVVALHVGSRPGQVLE